MLREKNLKKYTSVYTVDGERIGVILRFVHRPVEEVDIDLRLYRSYLVVQSLVLGGPAFIPTVYVADYNPETDRLDLAVDMKRLADELWNREPDFVARGLGVFEELGAETIPPIP
jgi:hypothetical protein